VAACGGDCGGDDRVTQQRRDKYGDEEDHNEMRVMPATTRMMTATCNDDRDGGDDVTRMTTV
jgi:hypothetical protein